MGAAASVDKDFFDEERRDRLNQMFEEELSKNDVYTNDPIKKKELFEALMRKGQEVVSTHESEKASSDQLASPASIRRVTGLNFVLAVDGSEASDIAYATTKSILKKHDRLCIFHAYNSDEDSMDIPSDRKSSAVIEKYESNLVATYPKEKYSILKEAKGDRSIKDVINNLVSLYKKLSHGGTVDFLVVGYTGWKGAHKDSGPTTAGSTADFAMRSIHVPIIISKEIVQPGGKKYAMCIDSTNKSKKGLEMLFTMLTPFDTLTLIHVNDIDKDTFTHSTHAKDAEELQKYYDREMLESSPTANCSYIVVMKEGMTPISEMVINKVDELECDFLALAPRSKAEKGITSFTETMILKVKCNIVLCKN